MISPVIVHFRLRRYCSWVKFSHFQICRLLRSTLNGKTKNTALPIIAAAKSKHWGLRPLTAVKSTGDNESTEEYITDVSISNILQNLSYINNDITDCVLCGLPLQNSVLIKDGGLWVFKCGHTFHGACLDLNKVKLCPSCSPVTWSFYCKHRLTEWAQ